MLLYQTYAKIHLNNIRSNILNIKKHVGQPSKILLAVKANAYGHGAIQVSRMAREIGVDFLGVATVPEAIQLRQAGIDLPILKFSPTFSDELEEALGQQITLALCSLDGLGQVYEVARKLKIRAKIHLKIDTGMGRVGILPAEISTFTQRFKNCAANLELQGVFSHFPVSDMPEFNAYTATQIQIFSSCVTLLENSLQQEIPLKHLANSGGVLGHPDSYFSMVRPGIMIYGFYPDETTPQTVKLLPGMSLFSKISHVKKVAANTPIDYGKTWIAPYDTYIGTIPIGYADGLNRLLSNKGAVLIREQRYPIVGRICMDQTMVHLGANSTINVGEKVTLIGTDGQASITVPEYAELLNTITYEVTCQINSRVTRVYEE